MQQKAKNYVHVLLTFIKFSSSMVSGYNLPASHCSPCPTVHEGHSTSVYCVSTTVHCMTEILSSVLQV